MITLKDIQDAAVAEKAQFLAIIAEKDKEIADLKAQVPSQDDLTQTLALINDIVPDPAPPTQEQPVG